MKQTTEDIDYTEVKAKAKLKEQDKEDSITDSAIDYLETWYKLTLMNITDKASGVASSIVLFIAVFIVGIFVLLFIGLALGTWLGELLNSAIAGYFVTAGIFLVAMLIVWAMRKRIMLGFRDFIIRKIYE